MKHTQSLESLIAIINAEKKNLKLDNATMAKLCEVHPSTISRVLNGKVIPDANTLISIFNGLKYKIVVEKMEKVE